MKDNLPLYKILLPKYQVKKKLFKKMNFINYFYIKYSDNFSKN